MTHLHRQTVRAMRGWMLLAAGLLMGVTACHAGAGDSHGKIDACGLVSAAAAGKILGAKVTVKPQDTSLAGPGAASICHYLTGRVGGGFMLLAGRVHYRSAAQEVAERKQEALTDTPAGIDKPSFMDVKGLGEAAYLAKAAGYFQLHVLDHGAVIVINMNRTASAANIAQARQLAGVALGHLK